MPNDNLYYDSAFIQAGSKNGQDWLRKYVHPPGDKGESYNGYPDISTQPTVHLEYRLEDEKGPVDYPTSPGSTMMILTPPGILFNHFVALAPLVNADPTYKVMMFNDNTSAPDITGNWGSYRPTYLSTTIQMDTTAFANTGMLYACQFSPAITVMNIKDFTEYISDMPNYEHLMSVLSNTYPEHKESLRRLKEWRQLNNEYNGSMPKPTLGNITAAQVQIVKLGRVPKAPGDIQMLSPKSYMGRATEGSFMVHSINQPANNFKTTGPGSYATGNGEGLISCFYEWENDAGESKLSSFERPSTPLVAIKDVMWGDWTWGITLIRNIATENVGVVTPRFAFKTILGLEVAPVMRGSLNAMARPPALYDFEALKNGSIIVQSRMDAMPAKYNILGLTAAITPSVVGAAADLIGNTIAGKDKTDETKEILQEVKQTDKVKEAINNAEDPTPNSNPIAAIKNEFSKVKKNIGGRPRRRNPRKAVKTVKTDQKLISVINKLEKSVNRLSLSQNKPPRRRRVRKPKIERPIKTVVYHNRGKRQ